jgi:sirohydrochlorin ferrochelatase
MDNHQVQGRLSSSGGADTPHRRQPFYKPHTALSTTGHWLKTVGMLSPLIIGEFVKDPERRWRYTRMAVIATAALSQGLHANRIERERQEGGEQRER